MKIIFAFTLMVVILLSCNRTQKKDEFQYAKDFYVKAKMEEHRIGVFSNISVGARGSIDTIDGSYQVSKIALELDSIDIFLPAIKHYMSDEQIKENFLLDEGIILYSELNKLSQEEALDSVKNMSITIMELMNKLKAFEVTGRPQLKMIFFRVSTNYSVVYISDPSSVEHNYWKTVIASGKDKFDDHWYYLKYNRLD